MPCVRAFPRLWDCRWELRSVHEAPAFVTCLDDLAMVGEPVEERGGHLCVAEDGVTELSMSNTIYFSLLRSWNRSIQCPFRSAMAARPGPVVQTDRNVAKLIAKARRGPFRKLFDYNGERRFVEPYGVLIGPRNYLVARQPSKGAELRHLRLDRIRDASVIEEWFCKDPDFSLARYASRSFGSFQDENEFRRGDLALLC